MKQGNQQNGKKAAREDGEKKSERWEKKGEPTKCREWSEKENERGREAETCAFCAVS
jgi:hypothetical protein